MKYRCLLNFLCDTMKMKKFNGFDENGYLPYGMYNMTFDEFKENFCKKSVKREDIFKEYEKHLREIIDTGYFLDHWIDGSFVSKKENPNDIDSLTEFDGKKVDENNDYQKVDDLINNSKSKTKGLCHSWRIYRFPASDEKKYMAYLIAKLRILTDLFGSDKNEIPKGIVHLIEVKL